MIVIESIIRDPDKYSFLVSSSQYYSGQYAASHPYTDVYRTLILDEAQKVFELMVRDLTHRIINETGFDNSFSNYMMDDKLILKVQY